ncbi:RNA-binding S4 domain-containing protein [bacterium]|nr:RNA-binding S4 domain-containing protein [bacterium]MBQ3642200.1 RNA-binding S4 domain-containing protein [bacterium]
MRLDKFLKVSRLIKRRTVANDVSDKGRISVNGNPAKPAKQLKPGDIITIAYAGGETSVEVLTIPTGNVSVQDAPTLYKVIKNFRNEN